MGRVCASDTVPGTSLTQSPQPCKAVLSMLLLPMRTMRLRKPTTLLQGQEAKIRSGNQAKAHDLDEEFPAIPSEERCNRQRLLQRGILSCREQCASPLLSGLALEDTRLFGLCFKRS